MKPEKLIICGWGPYKEEAVIDFTKFDTANLFLITGQTGAGKTTIFDAIAYALYGMLSGEVREKGSVRSDFADEDTKTYVELYMSHRGVAYHIVRNPEYLRPKKKKSKESAFTKEKENAALTLPDGTIIAGNQDVTRKVEELLGMDGRQFRQISMIAQGEFAKMLFANSNEKTAIFRELFGTGIYAEIQSKLKERSAKLYRDYMNYKNKMDEDVRILPLEDEKWENLISHEQIDFSAVEEYLSSKLEEMEILVKECTQKEKQAEEELLRIKEEAEKVRQINKRFKELTENKNKLALLEEKKEIMEQNKQWIQIVGAARLLALEEKVVEEKEQVAKACGERINNYETDLKKCCKELQETENVQVKKAEIREAYFIIEQENEIRERLSVQKEEMGKNTVLLQKARESYVKAQEDADLKRTQYEEADKLYKHAVIGVAARLLKDGEPCPVCGAVEHPHPAQVSEEIPDEKQLEIYKSRMEKTREVCSKHFETALKYQNEEKHLLEEVKQLEEQYHAIQAEVADIPKDIREYVLSTGKEVFEESLAKYLENQSRMVEKQRQIKETCSEYEQKKEECRIAREELKQRILQSGFSNLEAYEQAVSDIGNLAKMEQEVTAFLEQLTASRQLCEHLQQVLKGMEEKDEDAVNTLFVNKQSDVNELRKLLQEYHIKADQIKRSRKGIVENRKKAEAIRSEYGIVKDLDDLANGNNAKRLVFEQYVLAGYFEQVLKAANLRLFKMTDGRYELMRAKQVSDGRKKDNLEILVMDYYTGKERSVKTLSGGETFKASLALALGMSDCIQAENGGLEVETLFIDEGFGALDEESLEQACGVLQSLAGYNRMIGIISHVPELRERIEHQIVIEKKNFGSSVKVVV